MLWDNTIMKWIIILLFISTCAFSQTQGDTPNVKDGAIDRILTNCGQGCIKWPEPFVSGDTYAFCINTTPVGGPFPIADTLSNSYTCTPPTQTAGLANNGYANMCYTKATHSGNNTTTITVPGNSVLMTGVHLYNVGAVDGTVATASFAGNGAGGTGNISTTPTTTVNNDILASCAVTSTANSGSWVSSDSNGEQAASETEIAYLSIQRAGLAGAKTVTNNTWNGPCGFGCTLTTFAMQTLAFKPEFPSFTPTTIAITDTQLPQAASGITYAAKAHCAGGAGAQTFILTGSLPTGLTFNTTTGDFAGSTVVLGTTSLGLQCTDGTITSQTKTLSLKVGAGFGVPSVRAFVGSFDGFTGTVTNGQCGDMLHPVFRGVDTHSDAGWLQSVNGANNFISDSHGSPVQRMLLPFAGNAHTPINDYPIGPLTSNWATDVISGTNNQSANSGLQISAIYDIANVQDVSDAGSQANTLMQNGTIAVSYTTTVPNTMLLTAMTSMQSGGGGGLAFSLGAPWIVDSNGGDVFGHSIYAHTLVATPSTVSAIYTVTGAAFFAPFSAVIIPLRAGLPVAGCVTAKLHVESQVY